MGNTEIFVLRIWHAHEGGFRASVRRVDEDQSRLFSQADELTRFLCTAAEPALSRSSQASSTDSA